MKKVMYMHTIDGYPAHYWEREQVCFIAKYCKPQKALVPSLRQIKKEQNLSMAWRVKQGFDKKPQRKDYGWIKILV